MTNTDQHLNVQLMNPSAMDDAGLLMLDSVREIFDILEIPFESVKFNCEMYKTLNDLIQATFVERKCPIIEFPPSDYETSHVMVSTGVFHTKEGYFVECKDSKREDPNTPPGKIFKYIILHKLRWIFEDDHSSGINDDFSMTFLSHVKIPYGV